MVDVSVGAGGLGTRGGGDGPGGVRPAGGGGHAGGGGGRGGGGVCPPGRGAGGRRGRGRRVLAPAGGVWGRAVLRGDEAGHPVAAERTGGGGPDRDGGGVWMGSPNGSVSGGVREARRRGGAASCPRRGELR